MLAQETASAKVSRRALVQEVAQLKQRLTAIAAATGYKLAHDGSKGRAGMSGKAAGKDMANFWAEVTAKHGSSDGSTRVINSSRTAKQQLGDFFNSLPTGIKNSAGDEAKTSTLPKDAKTMSAYDKEYVAAVDKKYGHEAAEQVVAAAREGRRARRTRRLAQGSSVSRVENMLPAETRALLWASKLGQGRGASSSCELVMFQRACMLT